MVLVFNSLHCEDNQEISCLINIMLGNVKFNKYNVTYEKCYFKIFCSKAEIKTDQKNLKQIIQNYSILLYVSAIKL